MTRTIGYRLCLGFSCIMAICTFVSAFDCLSDDGSAVDWFLVYKLPEKIEIPPLSAGGSKRKSTGLEMLYMDATMTKMKVSPKLIGAKGHALSNTILQLFDKKLVIPDYMYLMYGSHPPEMPKATSKYWGHANGVVGFNKTGGFWLSHSLPRYPKVTNLNIDLQTNVKKNAQTFLCVSMDIRYLKVIDVNLQSAIPDITMVEKPEGEQLKYIWPMPFEQAVMDKRFPGVNDFPDLGTLRNRDKTLTHVNEKNFTVNGQRFYSFAKSRNYGKDIYKDFLSDRLDDELFIQFWPNVGSPRLPSDCEGNNNVYNVIKEVRFEVDNYSYYIANKKDHSKWVVSGSQKWFCIGDLNRQVSQTERGGGVICMQNMEVADVFRNAVGRSFESCPPQTTTVSNNLKRKFPALGSG